jgi:uncharacterized membrane protein YedE/YeeE
MTTQLWLGLVTGILLGFLMQKGRVIRFEKQVGALLLIDMTVFKFMLSAILVGSVGIYALAGLDIISLSHKPMNMGAILVGGALFGAGWAIMGFCPGTSMGAVGEGRYNALFAIAGMVAGAALHAELYPFFKKTVLAWKDFGKIGLPETLGLSPWIVIPVIWVAVIGLFYFFEKKGL